MFASKSGRALLSGGPYLFALAPAVVTMLLTWQRLPHEMATRFNVSATVTGSLSRPAILAGAIALGVLLAFTFGVVNAST